MKSKRVFKIKTKGAKLIRKVWSIKPQSRLQPNRKRALLDHAEQRELRDKS